MNLLLGKPFSGAADLSIAIAEHGKVQRALMKANSMAAIKPEVLAEFEAAVLEQKALLANMGDVFVRAIAEIESGENLDETKLTSKAVDLDEVVSVNSLEILSEKKKVNAVRPGDVFKTLDGQAATATRLLPGGWVELRFQGNVLRLGEHKISEIQSWEQIGRAEFMDGAFRTPDNLVALATGKTDVITPVSTSLVEKVNANFADIGMVLSEKGRLWNWKNSQDSEDFKFVSVRQFTGGFIISEGGRNKSPAGVNTIPTKVVGSFIHEFDAVKIAQARIEALKNIGMERFIKSTADSVTELREIDVHRVLVVMNKVEDRRMIAGYIKDNRPDLINEVDRVLKRGISDEMIAGIATMDEVQLQKVVDSNLLQEFSSSLNQQIELSEKIDYGKLILNELADKYGWELSDKTPIARKDFGVGIVDSKTFPNVDGKNPDGIRVVTAAISNDGYDCSLYLQFGWENVFEVSVDFEDRDVVDIAQEFNERTQEWAIEMGILKALIPSKFILPGYADLEIDHLKTRIVDVMPVESPSDWLVMNAPRPLLGTQTMNGDFLTGRFYAIINPDDFMAEKYIEENRKLDARLVVEIPRANQMEMVLVGSKYREQYLGMDESKRWDELSAKLTSLRDLPFGQVKELADHVQKIVSVKKDVVSEGRFIGRVLEVNDGIVTMSLGRFNSKKTVLHSTANLSRVPNKDELVDILYTEKRGAVSDERYVQGDLGR